MIYWNAIFASDGTKASLDSWRRTRPLASSCDHEQVNDSAGAALGCCRARVIDRVLVQTLEKPGALP